MKSAHVIFKYGSLTQTVHYFLPISFFLAIGLFGAIIHFYNKWYVDPDTPGFGRDGYRIQFSNLRTGAMIMASSGLMIIFGGLAMLSSHLGNLKRYRNGDYKIVNGKVKSLRDSLVREKGKTVVLFSIDTVQFNVEKGDDILERYGNGNLKNGQELRIKYFPVNNYEKQFLEVQIP